MIHKTSTYTSTVIVSWLGTPATLIGVVKPASLTCRLASIFSRHQNRKNGNNSRFPCIENVHKEKCYTPKIFNSNLFSIWHKIPLQMLSICRILPMCFICNTASSRDASICRLPFRGVARVNCRLRTRTAAGLRERWLLPQVFNYGIG